MQNHYKNYTVTRLISICGISYINHISKMYMQNTLFFFPNHNLIKIDVFFDINLNHRYMYLYDISNAIILF